MQSKGTVKYSPCKNEWPCCRCNVWKYRKLDEPQKHSWRVVSKLNDKFSMGTGGYSGIKDIPGLPV